MEDNKLLLEILQRLATLEALIKAQNYDAVKETSSDALNIAKNNESRITKLENAQAWIIKTIGVIIVGAIINIIINK